MKNILPLLLGAVLLTGCMHDYDVTLINGGKFTNVSKPKLDKKSGLYTFKTVNGKEQAISASRVVEIAPHSKKVKGAPPSPSS